MKLAQKKLPKEKPLLLITSIILFKKIQMLQQWVAVVVSVIHRRPKLELKSKHLSKLKSYHVDKLAVLDVTLKKPTTVMKFLLSHHK